MNRDDSVDQGESLLRRIPRNADYYDPSVSVSITPHAFRPNQQDTDGISLFRKAAISREALSETGRKPPYIVASVKARDLRDLGLSIISTVDDSGIPGHVVVPELSWDAYQSNKQSLKELTKKLAELASTDVYNPMG
jgi:hypothetical protein